jgi:hypothetical protein
MKKNSVLIYFAFIACIMLSASCGRHISPAPITGETDTPESQFTPTVTATLTPEYTPTMYLYGGTYQDEGCDLVLAADGGYVIAGTTMNYGTCCLPNVYLLKTDSNGHLLWQQGFGTSAYEEGYGLSIASDGGYIISGEEDASTGKSGFFAYLVKTDVNGNLEWEKTGIGTSTDASGTSVVPAWDGGYITQTYNGNVGLVKSSSTGSTQWSKAYTGGPAGKVIAVPGNAYVFAGAGQLIKTDISGNIIWQKTLSGRALSVRATSDGGYIAAGIENTFGGGGYDMFLSKTDSLGNEIWYKSYGGTGDEWGMSVAELLNGRFAVVGYTQPVRNIYIIVADAAGNCLNSVIFGPSGSKASAVIACPDGGFAVTGQYNTNQGDLFISKFDNAGVKQW